MKPESIEEKKAARKRDAVRGVVLFALLQGVSAVAFWALGMIPGMPGWCTGLFWVLAIGCLALLVPAFVVLRARFREIEGGELDAAGKY